MTLHKTAYLCADDTIQRYTISASQAWRINTSPYHCGYRVMDGVKWSDQPSGRVVKSINNKKYTDAIHRYGINEIKNILRASSTVVGECVIWDKCFYLSGYPRLSIPRFDLRAHRLSYMVNVDKMIKEEVIDHICQNKKCINHEHLRAVSNKENTLMNSSGVAYDNIRKKHCLHGHELSGDNLYIQKSTGFRYCRECGKIRRRRWHEKKLRKV